MIKREFMPPNWRWKAVEKGKKSPKMSLAWAPDEDTCRRRLEEHDYRVQWIEPFGYKAWCRESEEAIQALSSIVGSIREDDFDKAKWRLFSWHLFDLFDHKCAYCESRTRHVAPGDVEHFRPKGKGDDHPGYWWLAYDPQNFLPACKECNSSRKRSAFPISGAARATCREELDAEDPLLLDPYRDDPRPHLRFFDTGDVRGVTAQGTTSVNVYGLDRHGLRERRKARFESKRQDLQVSLLTPEGRDRSLEQIRDLTAGRGEYSAALLQHVDRVLADLERGPATLREAVPEVVRRHTHAPAVRPASLEDAAGIAAVAVRGWFEYQTSVPLATLIPHLDEGHRRAAVERELHSPGTFGFVAENARPEIIGYAVCDASASPEPLVTSLHVLFGHRRAGIGTRLLQQLATELSARRHASFTVDVLERNVAGRGLVERLGAKVLQSRAAAWASTADVREVRYRWADLRGLAEPEALEALDSAPV